MFEAIGRFSYRFRWFVIGLWVVLFGVSVIATPLLADVLQGGFGNPDAPAQQAAALVQSKFEQGPTNMLVVFQSDDLQATDEAFQSAQQEALDGLTAAGIPDLQSIQTYGSTGNPLLISEDGRSSVAVLNFSAPSEDVQKEVERIREALPDTGLATLRDRRAGRERGSHRLLLRRPAARGGVRAARGPARPHLRVRQSGVGGAARRHRRAGRDRHSRRHVPHRTGHEHVHLRHEHRHLAGAGGCHRLRALHRVPLSGRTAPGCHHGRGGGGDERPGRTIRLLQRHRGDGRRGGAGVLPLAGAALARYRRRAGGLLLDGGLAHLHACADGRARPSGQLAQHHQAARCARVPPLETAGPASCSRSPGSPSSPLWCSSPSWPPPPSP